MSGRSRVAVRFHLRLGLALSGFAACSDPAGNAASPGSSNTNGASDPITGSPNSNPGLMVAGAQAGTGSTAPTNSMMPPAAVKPPGTCAPPLTPRANRLQGRHLANSLRDLLALPAAPQLPTALPVEEFFLPNKAAAVVGTIAVGLATAVATLAEEATKPGKPFIKCGTAEPDCAKAFIDSFVSRAFRRPLNPEERTRLLALYEKGKPDGGHAGGIRLIIETVLQSPSFLYVSELGEIVSGTRRLTAFELASRIAFFLRDSIPDDDLWKAAESGQLLTAMGLKTQIDRLMTRDDVKANVGRIYQRLFDLEHVLEVTKAAEVKEFSSPGSPLAESMFGESQRFIDNVLKSPGAKLGELLTSTKTSVDARMAMFYGVKAPVGNSIVDVTLPADQRAGLLTAPALMASHAMPDDSSVVHRGVFIARELLCFHPPSPPADLTAAISAVNRAAPTERGRAEKRLADPVCKTCHTFFDAFGVSLENYDTLGRYRTKIVKNGVSYPVDASWQLGLHDLQGPVNGAIDLSQKLNASKAVRSCMVRQVASYALARRLDDSQLCTVESLLASFDLSQGNLLGLVASVAAWDGLRDRSEGDAP